MIWDAAQRAFKKIRATLGESALKYIEKAGGAFHETAFGVSDYSEHGEILDNVLIGIEDRRVVFITYRSQRSTESVTYPIHPYCIKRQEGSLYVHGHKPDDGELRTWKLERIEQAVVDPMPFTIPADLDLETRFAGSLGIYDGRGNVHVKIRFAPEVTRYISEKRWHSSQQLTPQKDGSLIVELWLSNTVELKNWVLSFGANAEVLEPGSLRDEIREELQRAIPHYDTHAEQRLLRQRPK
jgi:predicted DNA-binding transcriptional regulator YafY